MVAPAHVHDRLAIARKREVRQLLPVVVHVGGDSTRQVVWPIRDVDIPGAALVERPGKCGSHWRGHEVVRSRKTEDPVDGKRSAGLDFRRRILGDDAFIRQRFYNCQFDIEPSLVFVLVFPNLPHSGACVTWNHFLSVGPTTSSTIAEWGAWVRLVM